MVYLRSGIRTYDVYPPVMSTSGFLLNRFIEDVESQTDLSVSESPHFDFMYGSWSDCAFGPLNKSIPNDLSSVGL